MSDPAAEDGRYDVYPEAVGGLRVGVYCHAMNGTPQEYITLNHPNEGVYPNLANKNCHGETETESPKKTGKSTFHKIRIDLKVCACVRVCMCVCVCVCARARSIQGRL